MSPEQSLLVSSLGFFKDWTNYLLVTTVAALGWVATKPMIIDGTALKVTVACLCLSIVFAMLTLALIPLVGEQLATAKSIYDAQVTFNLLWLWGPEGTAKLKWFCWPQHVFFLAGMITFSIGTMRRVY